MLTFKKFEKIVNKCISLTLDDNSLELTLSDDIYKKYELSFHLTEISIDIWKMITYDEEEYHKARKSKKELANNVRIWYRTAKISKLDNDSFPTYVDKFTTLLYKQLSEQ